MSDDEDEFLEKPSQDKGPVPVGKNYTANLV